LDVLLNIVSHSLLIVLSGNDGLCTVAAVVAYGRVVVVKPEDLLAKCFRIRHVDFTITP
jgi:hypothetical protein